MQKRETAIICNGCVDVHNVVVVQPKDSTGTRSVASDAAADAKFAITRGRRAVGETPPSKD